MIYKKTHEGKSPTQILKGAHVAETNGGGFEIFLPDGRVIARTEEGEIVFPCPSPSDNVCIKCTPRAFAKLERLNDEKKEKYNERYLNKA